MASTGQHNGVAQGGFYGGHRVTYSKDTHNLIKTMMQESRLTNFQQRQLDKTVRGGDSLPNNCHPTSSAKPRKPPQKKVLSKVLNPKNYSSHIRSKNEIEASGAYEREQYHPSPLTKFGGYYEKDKQRLSNIMAFGEDVEPPSQSKKKNFIRKKKEEEEEKEEKNVDRFKELEEEINERRQFLNDMESHGQGEKYRVIIETEISQMVREMELIDKKRNDELQEYIRSREKNKRP